MKPFATQRRLGDPNDQRGAPTVSARRPVPVRDRPLAGTKVMLTPPDGSLVQRLSSGARLSASCVGHRGRIAGALGLSLAILVPLFAVVSSFFEHLPGTAGEMLMGLGFVAVHVLAMFSQMASGGLNLPGALSIPVLYGGLVAFLIINHFV